MASPFSLKPPFFNTSAISSINKGNETLTKAQLRNILLFILFYEYVGRFVGMDNSHDTIFMLTIFLIARYTRIYITPPYKQISKDRNGLDGLRSCLELSCSQSPSCSVWSGWKS